MNDSIGIVKSILQSSIWLESRETVIVWLTMLLMQDNDGFVDGQAPEIAEQARVSIEECEHALDRLSSIDKYSKNKDHDGKRIIKKNHGWQIVSAPYYQNMCRENAWRQCHAEKMRERRKNSAGDNVKNKTKKAEKHPKGWSVPVWESYATAYKARHGAEPISNASAYGACTNLREKLGDDAIPVAAWYIKVDDRVYLNGCHPLNLLVRDAQKIHTMWKRGLKSMDSKYYGPVDPQCRKENIKEL